MASFEASVVTMNSLVKSGCDLYVISIIAFFILENDDPYASLHIIFLLLLLISPFNLSVIGVANSANPIMKSL